MIQWKSSVTAIAALSLMSVALPARTEAAYLIMPSDPDNAAFRSLVAGFLGEAVDYYDASAGTPTVTELQAYKGVFTWTNSTYSNSTLLGDNLAAYVDGGGRVVLGAFTTYASGSHLGGAIMTSAYSPVTSPTGSNAFISDSYSGDGVTSLWTGVASYGAFYRDNVILQGTGILDGTFADGSIAAAYRPDGLVVYLGGMETLTQTTGDSARLLANALQGVSAAEVPEPATFGFAGLGLAILGVVTRLRKKA
ncbi:PEP-CTERM sorting domain-containing protein [uncultured Paludibaculum sp.]|uniref:PEP-CTERM sorting domain-containing protein n=1 Tax=uncultured Paludibaculum sp. TaxID=1765020 RepID=UPI002AAC21D5|nr:PEP-CTERM sorting domain-containing protein [uncultured Paludibaculum sp.]